MKIVVLFALCGANAISDTGILPGVTASTTARATMATLKPGCNDVCLTVLPSCNPGFTPKVNTDWAGCCFNAVTDCKPLPACTKETVDPRCPIAGCKVPPTGCTLVTDIYEIVNGQCCNKQCYYVDTTGNECTSKPASTTMRPTTKASTKAPTQASTKAPTKASTTATMATTTACNGVCPQVIPACNPGFTPKVKTNWAGCCFQADTDCKRLPVCNKDTVDPGCPIAKCALPAGCTQVTDIYERVNGQCCNKQCYFVDTLGNECRGGPASTTMRPTTKASTKAPTQASTTATMATTTACNGVCPEMIPFCKTGFAPKGKTDWAGCCFNADTDCKACPVESIPEGGCPTPPGIQVPDCSFLKVATVCPKACTSWSGPFGKGCRLLVCDGKEACCPSGSTCRGLPKTASTLREWSSMYCIKDSTNDLVQAEQCKPEFCQDRNGRRVLCGDSCQSGAVSGTCQDGGKICANNFQAPTCPLINKGAVCDWMTDGATQCIPGLVCNGPQNELGTCVEATQICGGDKCASAAKPSFCNGNKCIAFRTKGESCGGFTKEPLRCAGGLRCKLPETCCDMSGTCVESCECTKELKPVCGKDGTTTFPNACFAKCAGALPVTDGQCDRCNSCAGDEPMCGDDGVTYPNKCATVCAGRNIAYSGACRKCKTGDYDPKAAQERCGQRYGGKFDWNFFSGDGSCQCFPRTCSVKEKCATSVITLTPVITGSCQRQISLNEARERCEDAGGIPDTPTLTDSGEFMFDCGCQFPVTTPPPTVTTGTPKPVADWCKNSPELRCRLSEGIASTNLAGMITISRTCKAPVCANGECAMRDGTCTCDFTCVTPKPDDCVCTDEVNPVCGSNSKEYSNPCEARCKGVTMFKKGACPQPCLCDKVLKPVCGADGNDYPNECMATCAGVKVAYDVKCQDKCTAGACAGATSFCFDGNCINFAQKGEPCNGFTATPSRCMKGLVCEKRAMVCKKGEQCQIPDLPGVCVEPTCRKGTGRCCPTDSSCGYPSGSSPVDLATKLTPMPAQFVDYLRSTVATTPMVCVSLTGAVAAAKESFCSDDGCARVRCPLIKCGDDEFRTMLPGRCCPVCIKKTCSSYYNGCNTCKITSILGAQPQLLCTTKACLQLEAPYCRAFEDGTTCTSAKRCTSLCAHKSCGAPCSTCRGDVCAAVMETCQADGTCAVGQASCSKPCPALKCPDVWRGKTDEAKKHCRLLNCVKPMPDTDGCVVGCTKCQISCRLKFLTLKVQKQLIKVNFEKATVRDAYIEGDCNRFKQSKTDRSCAYTFSKVTSDLGGRRLGEGDTYAVGATYTCSGDDCDAALTVTADETDVSSATFEVPAEVDTVEEEETNTTTTATSLSTGSITTNAAISQTTKAAVSTTISQTTQAAGSTAISQTTQAAGSTAISQTTQAAGSTAISQTTQAAGSTAISQTTKAAGSTVNSATTKAAGSTAIPQTTQAAGSTTIAIDTASTKVLGLAMVFVVAMLM